LLQPRARRHNRPILMSSTFKTLVSQVLEGIRVPSAEAAP
jgi:hypothetical protein